MHDFAMALTFTPLHPLFAAEAGDIDLSGLRDESTLAEIRAGMDRYGVLVFRHQPFTDAQQIEFAQRFDGTLHTQSSQSEIGRAHV